MTMQTPIATGIARQPHGLRVIVCGGRDYWNPSTVASTLDAIHKGERGPIHAVIHGNARGADTLGKLWAETNEVLCWPYPAVWSKHGKAAGPIRNKIMLGLSPDLVVAFPGKRGTRNMVKQARAAGVEVMEIPQ